MATSLITTTGQGAIQTSLRARLNAARSQTKLRDSSVDLGYYTSHQASQIIADTTNNFDWDAYDNTDWRAYEKEMNEKMLANAPPLTNRPTRVEPEGPDLLAKFTVIGGLVFAVGLLVATLVRTGSSSKSGAPAKPETPLFGEPGEIPDIDFDDIPGQEEAKEQLQEVVRFLRDPQGQQYGTVLTGPGQADNVQLATAVAGEAAKPVFRLSGKAETAEFAETFAKARAAAPSVMILEDVESLGLTAVAALLTQMDQLEETQTPMALIAATARIENVAPALSKLFGLRVMVMADAAKMDLEAQLARAMGETPPPKAEQGQKSDFWQRVDDEIWDFAVGKKEKRWNPDRRDDKTRVTPENSTLSWGGVRPETDDYSIETLEEMAEGLLRQAEGQLEIDRQRKDLDMDAEGATEREILDERFVAIATIADVPTGIDRVLSGRQLAELCFNKYGCYYDMNLLQFKPFGGTMPRQIAFNIYGATLGSSNFSYSERQYIEKLEMVSQILNSLDHAWYVRAFLKEPIRPRRGLPSTPRSDTAVTLRLNTSPTWHTIKESRIKEFFP